MPSPLNHSWLLFAHFPKVQLDSWLLKHCQASMTHQKINPHYRLNARKDWKGRKGLWVISMIKETKSWQAVYKWKSIGKEVIYKCVLQAKALFITLLLQYMCWLKAYIPIEQMIRIFKQSASTSWQCYTWGNPYQPATQCVGYYGYKCMKHSICSQDKNSSRVYHRLLPYFQLT